MRCIKIETRGKQEEAVKKPDGSLKKRKTGEKDVNPGEAWNLTADTPKR